MPSPNLILTAGWETMKVELRNIHKSFGKVHANDDISMIIPAGTIQGILGENGAGKSTLMKVLTGFIKMDQGEILLDDKPVKISSPADAIHNGIGMLHQDPLDFPPMRILDNFLIGRENVGLFPNRRRIKREFLSLQEQFGFNIDPDSYVDTLTVGERQQLEILRLLWMGARVLILDEPTTGISSSQREKLFATLRKLVEQGMSVIFVSHKLEEIQDLCGRAAVMRRGKLIGEATAPFNTDQLVRMMFGKAVPIGERTFFGTNQVALKISGLSIEDSRLHIANVNLDAYKGEVIGLAGMEGSGQRQFLRTLGGLIRPVGGKIYMNGKDLTSRPYMSFLRCGISYVPAARLEEGLISGLSLTDHFILARKQSGFFVNRDAALNTTQRHIEEFNIRGTPTHRVEALSGGNQQRALLALQRSPLNLLLMEHPTRGLDIESTIWIWSKLKERCKQSTSIIFISSDLDELLQYSDRILVFFGGKVSQPLDAATTTVDQLGQLIGGMGF